MKRSSLFALLIICMGFGLAMFTMGKVFSNKPVHFPIQTNGIMEQATEYLKTSRAPGRIQGGSGIAQTAASKREQVDQPKAARPSGSVRDEDRLRRVVILLEALREGRGAYGSSIR